MTKLLANLLHSPNCYSFARELDTTYLGAAYTWAIRRAAVLFVSTQKTSSIILKVIESGLYTQPKVNIHFESEVIWWLETQQTGKKTINLPKYN